MATCTPASGSLRLLDCLLFIAAGICAASPVTGQSLTSTGSLSFGSFAAVPGGVGGTVVVAPNGGRIAPSGGVMLTGNAGFSAATFTVSGTPGAAYSISLPMNGTVFLSDGNGHTMALNGFASNPGATGMLSGGTQVLGVGATLSVAMGQAPASYSGSFSVTVNYP